MKASPVVLQFAARGEKAQADERMRVVASELANIMNRAESEKRSLTLKEQTAFNLFDEELTRLLERYGPPTLVSVRGRSA